MTTIYRISSNPDLPWLTMVDEENFTVLSQLEGEPMQMTWVPVSVVPLIEKGAPQGPLSDFPNLGSVPAFSQRAVDHLRPLLEPNGELLPLLSTVGSFYLYNVTTVVDALDEDRSRITRFKSTGRIMQIDQYVFRPERLNALMIFKIPQLPSGDSLVTEPFRQAVVSAGLSGLEFRPVWQSAD